MNCWNYSKGLTQSFIHSFQSCKLLTYLNYVEGWTPIQEPFHFRFGHAIHYCLENTYRLGKPLDIDKVSELVQFYFKQLQVNPTPEVEEENKCIEALATAILPFYFAYYADDFKNNWIKTEETFAIPFQNTTLRGVFDGVFKTQDNTLHLIDHKCLSVIQSDLEESLKWDLQLSFYCLAARTIHNKTPKSVIYNIIRRPRRNKGDDSAQKWAERVKIDLFKQPEKYFIRLEIPFDEDELLEWRDTQLSALCSEIRQWEEKKYPIWPYNTDAWFGKYGTSKYYQIIKSGNTLGFFQRTNPFPELGTT